MANKELPSDDYISKSAEDGIEMLLSYLDTYQPTLETPDQHDPFLLAQQWQYDLDKEKSKNVRMTMGVYGRDTLNQKIPTYMISRRLAMVTNRLFALTDSDNEDGRWAEGYSKPVLVSGMFDAFVFGASDNKDRLCVELIHPRFLRPRLDKQSERFASANRFAIPVEAIGARIYDPESFFHADTEI